MIRVMLFRTPDGALRSIEARGHAGWASDGEDILCAAVSVVIQTAIGALQDLAKLEPEYLLEDGNLRCTLPEPEQMTELQRGTAQIILETAAIGCRQIEESYGSRHVTVGEQQIHGNNK